MTSSVEGWTVSPRKSRKKSLCFSSTVTSTPARARRNPRTMPAGPPPAMQQRVVRNRAAGLGDRLTPREPSGSDHSAAGRGAGLAGGDTFPHGRQRLAIARAGLADFGAQRAGLAMELAFVRHQIGGHLADCGAVHHQAEMLRPHMIAAHFQAFGHRGGQADRMAAQTFLNAMAGFLGELVHAGRAPGPLAGEPSTRNREVPFRTRHGPEISLV